jgi:hypothetical protein
MKTYLSRRDAAQKYDVSIGKLRRWEEKGSLHRIDAYLVDQNKNHTGSVVQWVYDEEEVRALAENSPSKHVVARNHDAKVFELFDAGKNVVEVVRHTKLPVKEVQKLREIYDKETGSLSIHGSIVAEMEDHRLSRKHPEQWPKVIGRIIDRYYATTAKLRRAEEALKAYEEKEAAARHGSAPDGDEDDDDDKGSSK